MSETFIEIENCNFPFCAFYIRNFEKFLLAVLK